MATKSLSAKAKIAMDLKSWNKHAVPNFEISCVSSCEGEGVCVSSVVLRE